MELSQSNEVGGSPSSPAPDKSPLKIFINYRHDDTKGTAWALYFKLEERFGAENVFFDNGTLQPGMRWPTEIRSHLGAGGAFLALIGQDWLPILDARLQSGAEDYVAEEIDLALRGGPGMTVIPVLVDEAKLPDSGQLPSSLRTLLSCHQEHLRHTHFPHDTDNLIRRLGQIQEGREVARVDTGDPPRRRRRRPRRERVAPPPDQEHYEMVAGHADNLVIFLGAGANADHDEPWSMGSGMLPDDRDLVKHLASHIGLKEAPRHLAEIAQYVGTVYGEMELFEWITQALRVESEPNPVHRYLARLPGRLGGRYQMIVTSKFDVALEQAFLEARGAVRRRHLHGAGDRARGPVRPRDNGATRTRSRSWRRTSTTGFPIVGDDGQLTRTVIVRINGSDRRPRHRLPLEEQLRDHRGSLHRLPRRPPGRGSRAHADPGQAAPVELPVPRLRPGRLAAQGLPALDLAGREARAAPPTGRSSAVPTCSSGGSGSTPGSACTGAG